MVVPSSLFHCCLMAALCGSPDEPDPDVWPGFRGRGDSVSMSRNLPVSWPARGGRRGGWTVRLPGYGQSSPVVWRDQTYVTAVSGEEKERLHVICVGLDDGARRWECEFPATQRMPDSDSVSRGAPTPVVAAEAVFVMFESGDLFALTHEGDELWRRSLVAEFGEFKGPHGYASSPVLAGGFVVLQVCHSGPSYVLALDPKSGDTAWRTDHPSQTGWSTPAVVSSDDGELVIVSSAGSVRAYDARDGREQWFVVGLAGNSTASPSVAGDLVLIGASQREAASPANSLGIRLGGAGDVTESHVVWRSPRASTGYSSPVAAHGLAWFVNKSGVAACVDVATGEVLWTVRLPGECWASPAAFDDKVAFFCKGGDVVVYRAAPEEELLGESSVSATDIVYGIAAVDAAWLVRTGRSLIKVAADPGTANAP
ncbi:MAG: PQQ-like beta-propeller repeat protein [Planctomyces sp.]|nr:PQQ-like beta-propeller repeat protein [Planctomyces sp.]